MSVNLSRTVWISSSFGPTPLLGPDPPGFVAPPVSCWTVALMISSRTSMGIDSGIKSEQIIIHLQGFDEYVSLHGVQFGDLPAGRPDICQLPVHQALVILVEQVYGHQGEGRDEIRPECGDKRLGQRRVVGAHKTAFQRQRA